MSDLSKQQRKGRRTENEAKNVINMVYRVADRVERYGNNDPFHMADIIAIRPNWPVLIVQVKANGSINKKSYTSRASPYIDGKHAEFEIWNREDYFGWHIWRYNPGKGMHHVLDIEETNYKDAGPIYRKHVHERLDVPDYK